MGPVIRGSYRWRIGVLCGCLTFVAFAADAAPGTTAYTYDALGRVASVTYPNGQVAAYIYDSRGNRMTVETGSAPAANPVALTLAVNSAKTNVPLSIGGPHDAVAGVTLPAHGALTVEGVTIKYKPTVEYTGADSFTYTASNGASASAPATALISVTPDAIAIDVSVPANSASNPITTDVVGAFSSVALATLPTHGTATAVGTSITYTPAANYSGPDSFRYTAGVVVSATPHTVASSTPATISVTVMPAAFAAGRVSALMPMEKSSAAFAPSRPPRRSPPSPGPS